MGHPLLRYRRSDTEMTARYRGHVIARAWLTQAGGWRVHTLGIGAPLERDDAQGAFEALVRWAREYAAERDEIRQTKAEKSDRPAEPEQ